MLQRRAPNDLDDDPPIRPSEDPRLLAPQGSARSSASARRQAGACYGRWVRKTVGITDTARAPAHAWRHRFEDRARIAGLPQNVTDALLGHLNPMSESEGYGRGFRCMPEATAPWVAKMAA